MSYTLSIGLLIIMAVLTIVKNFRAKSSDKIIMELDFPLLVKINTSFFVFWASLFLFMIIMRKGIFQVSIFWLIFSLFWLYTQGQKKVVLEKGLANRDFFKNCIYILPFSDMSKVEKTKPNTLKISYNYGKKEYALKVTSSEKCIEEFIQVIRKKTKIRNI